MIAHGRVLDRRDLGVTVMAVERHRAGRFSRSTKRTATENETFGRVCVDRHGRPTRPARGRNDEDGQYVDGMRTQA